MVLKSTQSGLSTLGNSGIIISFLLFRHLLVHIDQKVLFNARRERLTCLNAQPLKIIFFNAYHMHSMHKHYAYPLSMHKWSDLNLYSYWLLSAHHHHHGQGSHNQFMQLKDEVGSTLSNAYISMH